MFAITTCHGLVGRRVSAPSAAFLAMSIVWACTPIAPVTTSSAHDSVRTAKAEEAVRPAMTQLTYEFISINEYHDEQKLSDGAQGYGPFAHVFATPTTETFSHVAQFNGHGTEGALVAVVWVEEGELPQTYQRLNLTTGVNCVRLAHVGPTGTANWSAYIRPADPTTLQCPPNVPTGAGPTNLLEVHYNQLPGHSALRDYPGSARFADATFPTAGGATSQPVIGVKCLAGWCEIGPQSFTSVRPLNDAYAVLGSRGVIKGWHDEQRLAVMEAGKLMPKLRATVTPQPNIETLDDDAFACAANCGGTTGTRVTNANGWRLVAVITFFDDPANTVYAERGLKLGPNTVEIRNNLDLNVWEARVTPATVSGAGFVSSGQPILRTVMRHRHYDVSVPGTARFKWSHKDETVWVRCSQGCCEVEL